MAILTMQQLRQSRVPSGSLTIWWLGQAGFIVKNPGGRIVAIDPYLSNSCKVIGDQCGFDMDRMAPPPMAPAEPVALGHGERYIALDGRRPEAEGRSVSEA